LMKRVRRIPRRARSLVAIAIGSVAPSTWDRGHEFVAPVLPAALRHRLLGEKLYKLRDLLRVLDEPGMYRSLLSAWQEPRSVVRGAQEAEGSIERILGSHTPEALLDRMVLADQVTYLADDLLAKLDRVSMAVSLEARVPLLDHRVVEFAWRLPHSLKIRNGTGKWILRQVLARRIPPALFERPKMGFSVPLSAWLRGPLRPWAEDLLSADTLAADGIFSVATVRRAWGDLMSGRRDTAMEIWAVLMFQAWKQAWIGETIPTESR
jgi:asparagine synthase (glutamine-hydrolysing)